MSVHVIGANIRRARAAKAIPAKELAARAKCSQGALAQIELGREVPSIALVCRIARELGVRPAELFDGVDTYHREAVEGDF